MSGPFRVRRYPKSRGDIVASARRTAASANSINETLDIIETRSTPA